MPISRGKKTFAVMVSRSAGWDALKILTFIRHINVEITTVYT